MAARSAGRSPYDASSTGAGGVVSRAGATAGGGSTGSGTRRQAPPMSVNAAAPSPATARIAARGGRESRREGWSVIGSGAARPRPGFYGSRTL